MAFVLPPYRNMTIKELKEQIHSYGKRALSRIRTLQKTFGENGKFYGDKSYILDTYGDFDTKVKGKSKSALYRQLDQAYSILNAQTSTVKGYSEWLKNKHDSFREHHPLLRDENGKDFDEDRYDRAMKFLGRLQSAEKGAGYDSDEQVALAYQYADKSEEDRDKLIADIINKETSTPQEWEKLSFDQQRIFLTVDEDAPQENGDQNNKSGHKNGVGADVETARASSEKRKSGADRKRGKR